MTPKKRKKPRKSAPRKMPKRPIQHVQEDRSRRAFEAALPDEWVFRAQDHDYGIDGEVEIFREELATGRLFKVQLKSTGDSISRALKVRLLNEKVEYYSALRLPILIVRYHEPSKTLYGKWFHSFDPHYGGRNQKSITLSLSDKDILEADRWVGIASDVEMFYRMRDPLAALPITFEISATEQVRGASGEACILATLNASSRFRDILRIGQDDSEPVRGSISLSDEATVVSFRDVASATGHHSVEDDGSGKVGGNPGLVANDAMLTLALAFDQIGQTDAAARLAAAFARDSSLLYSPDVLFRVIGLFARSHRVSEAVGLADDFGFIGERESDMLAALFLTPAMLRSSYLSEGEQDNVTRHLTQRISFAEENGTDRDVGIAHYNLANHLRSRGAWDEAASHFALAAHFDPDYWERDYFAHEFAGALFHTGQFDLSVEMYEKAISFGNEGITPALRADALMGAGRYLDAQDAFRKYNQETGTMGEDEWRLKEWALDKVRKVGGDRQPRSIDEAMRLADVSDPDLTEDQREDQLLRAMEADALCAGAWFNLGVLRAGQGDIATAFEGFLIAALVLPHDVNAWVRALVCSIESEESESLLDDIATCGYRWNRGTFIEALTEALAQFDDSYPKKKLLETVRTAIANVPASRDQGPVELRTLMEGSKYESIVIPGPPE